MGTWVSFVLINGSFIALTSWASSVNWPQGFAYSMLYCIALLVVPYYLRRRNGGRDSILTSLLFPMAIISIAVTGLYLPVFVFPCSSSGNDYYIPTKGEW